MPDIRSALASGKAAVASILPVYMAAKAWQKAHKAYAEAIRYRSYPKHANGLLDTLLEAEKALLVAIAAAQRPRKSYPRRPNPQRRAIAPAVISIQEMFPHDR